MKRIELDESRIPVRLFAAVGLLILGLTLLGVALAGWLSVDKGWTQISYDGTGGSGQSMIHLSYAVGMGDVKPNAEYKAVHTIYNDVLDRACRALDAAGDTTYAAEAGSASAAGTDSRSDSKQQDDPSEAAASGAGLAALNANPNMTLELDPILYRALEKLQALGGDHMYLGPLYADTRSLLYSTTDEEADALDPRVNPDEADFTEQILRYAGDRTAVELELLDGYRAVLQVSPEYEAYAAENDVTEFIGFGWMKNAFILDAAAERLLEAGFDAGYLESTDGFARDLDRTGSEEEIGALTDLTERGSVILAANFRYDCAAALVWFRDHAPGMDGAGLVYDRGDGTVRTGYLSEKDGLCHQAVHTMVGYSADGGCAELALRMKDAYIADEPDENLILGLAQEGIYAIYCDNATVFRSGTAELMNLYRNDTLQYTAGTPAP